MRASSYRACHGASECVEVGPREAFLDHPDHLLHSPLLCGGGGAYVSGGQRFPSRKICFEILL